MELLSTLVPATTVSRFVIVKPKVFIIAIVHGAIPTQTPPGAGIATVNNGFMGIICFALLLLTVHMIYPYICVKHKLKGMIAFLLSFRW